MATIRQKTRRDGSTTYSVRFRLGGRGSTETTVSYDSEAKAQKFAELLALVGPEQALRIARGDDTPPPPPEPTGPTLADFLTRHVDELTSAHDGTKARYRTYIAQLRDDLGAHQLTEVTTRDVQAWVAQMQTAKKAGKTIKNHHGFVAGALNAAVREGLIEKNPCDSVRLIASTRKTEPVFLTPAQVHEIADTIAPRYKPFVLWLAGTGMRFSEATALTVGDIDPEKCTARIHQAWKYVPGEPLVLGAPKSRKSVRTVSFPAALLTGIDLKRPKGALVFPGPDGTTALWGSTFRYVWARAVKGITPRPRVHDLRHTCASLMIAAGVPLPVIQAHLGHESITTTIGTYGSLDRDASSRAAAAIGAALG